MTRIAGALGIGTEVDAIEAVVLRRRQAIHHAHPFVAALTDITDALRVVAEMFTDGFDLVVFRALHSVLHEHPLVVALRGVDDVL